MSETLVIDDPESIKVLAAIGNVCLQYSNLELFVAVIIWVLLDLDEDKGAIVVGGTDLVPRIQIALGLLEEMRSPSAFRRRLRAILTKLRDDRLIDRRNQAVHGAHKVEGAVRTLTMLRWKKAKRHEAITLQSLWELGVEIHKLSMEMFDLIGVIETWRVRVHGPIHGFNNVPEGDAIHTDVKLAKSLHARIKHLYRNLFG